MYSNISAICRPSDRTVGRPRIEISPDPVLSGSDLIYVIKISPNKSYVRFGFGQATRGRPVQFLRIQSIVCWDLTFRKTKNTGSGSNILSPDLVKQICRLCILHKFSLVGNKIIFIYIEICLTHRIINDRMEKYGSLLVFISK